MFRSNRALTLRSHFRIIIARSDVETSSCTCNGGSPGPDLSGRWIGTSLAPRAVRIRRRFAIRRDSREERENRIRLRAADDAAMRARPVPPLGLPDLLVSLAPYGAADQLLNSAPLLLWIGLH